MDLSKDLQEIETGLAPTLTLVEEFAPDLGLLATNPLGGAVAIVRDMVAHYQQLVAAVNGITATIKLLKGTPAAVVPPGPAPAVTPAS